MVRPDSHTEQAPLAPKHKVCGFEALGTLVRAGLQGTEELAGEEADERLQSGAWAL